MISINATLIIQVINFLVLVFIINRIMFRPVAKLIDERTQFISKAKTEIEDLAAETEKLKKEFTAMQNDARRNAAQEKSELRGAAMAEADKFIEDSRAEVSSIREEAEKEAEKEYSKTRPLLGAEAASLAGEIIQKVIGRRIEA